MNRNLTWLLSVTLFLMLALSIGLILQLPRGHSTNAGDQAAHPDMFVVQATYLRLDPNGHLQSKLYTPQMMHYSKDSRSEFSAPHLVTYGQDQLPWVISAEHGQSQFGTQQIELWGNVKVQHLAAQQQPELTLLTSSLKYFPEQQLAQTDQPVTIVQPGMLVNSQGLKADLKSASVQLISHVRARYELKTN